MIRKKRCQCQVVVFLLSEAMMWAVVWPAATDLSVPRPARSPVRDLLVSSGQLSLSFLFLSYCTNGLGWTVVYNYSSDPFVHPKDTSLPSSPTIEIVQRSE